jgi:uncharacterized membrane protein HdeD (DUF308 family)
MKNKILKSWRVVTIKGLVTTLLGLFTFYLLPAYAEIFIRLFGTLLIVSGSILIYDFVVNNTSRDRSWRLVEGMLDGIYGVITIILVWVNAGNFLPVITSWIILTGILQVTNAYRLRSLFHHWKALMLNGILAIAFSSGIVFYPRESQFNKAVILMSLLAVFIAFLLISSYYLKKLVEDIQLEIPGKQGEEANQELSYF